MKKIRIISFLLTLVMVLSLFSGLTASAKTGTVKTNTGKRHELCTSLSSQAKAYYTGEYTYDSLSALEGGNASCLSSATTGSPLFKKLNKLMTDTMTKSVSYSSLTGYWEKTDANNGSSDAVLFYSDSVSGSYNREHVWPKSRASFLKQDGGCDIHHLRPTNSSVNSTRSNYTMGNVRAQLSSYETKSYNGKTVLYYKGNYTGNGCHGLVEINDNIKGDVARIFLYVYVRWKEPNLFENDPNPVVGPNDNENNGYKVIESLDTLLQWCEMDPVDSWEMGRNDQCENVQGNRNVFIDYPELGWLIFGQEIPEDMSTPSGEAQDTVHYNLTAKSNDEELGTVSLNRKTITATPKAGCAISKTEPYTVSPKGAAYVQQNGSSFTVSNMTSDCTVTINFEKLVPATLTYSVPEGVSCIASDSGYVGYSVKLPTVSNVPEGFTFWRWSESFADRTIADSYPGYKSGADYTLTKESATLYAVFYYNEKQDGGWLFTSTPSLCDHANTELRNVKEATCTEDGNTGDTYCLDCSNYILRGTVLPALGHDYKDGVCTRCGACQHLHTEVKNAKEATCTEDGYTGDIYCLDCGTKVYPGVTVKAMGHDYEDGSCANCGEKDPNSSGNNDDPKPPVDDPKPPVDDPAQSPFKDVKESDYYAEPVRWAVQEGITTGTSATTFSPNDPCTRGQIVTFLWRACGSPEPTTTENPFKDVSSGEYYYKAVLWAVEKGITNGLSDTSFGPNETCTRGQVATFLWRAQGKPAPASSENPFSDVRSSDYYYEAILWAVENNVTQGIGGGRFAPNDNCTRGQIVTFLYRAIAE